MTDMAGYTKLFGSIIASTIWREDNDTRIVWITMLAMANKDGIVEASVPGLADMARVSVDKARIAVAKLESPDEDSRTKDNQGRRIAPVDGGWIVLNHAKYRAKLSADERREYFRLNKQKNRALSTNVQQCPIESTDVTHSEAEADTKAVQIHCASAPDAFREKLEALRKRIGGWFNRRESTIWGEKELKALKAVLTLGTSDDDLSLLETYYNSKAPYLRKDIGTLLNNWNGEIDRAKSFKNEPAQPASKGVSVFELTKIIEAKTKMAQELKNRYAVEGPLSTDWNDQAAHQEYIQFCKEIKAANLQLAKM